MSVIPRITKTFSFDRTAKRQAWWSHNCHAYVYYMWPGEGCLYFHLAEGFLIHELNGLTPFPPQSTLNKRGHRGRLVVCFVCDLLPSCPPTRHIINSYKDEQPYVHLAYGLALKLAGLCSHSHPPQSSMNYSQHSKEGHHFEMWPGQQITFCFSGVVKVNVSGVSPRVIYSGLGHFADWMTRPTISLWTQKEQTYKSWPTVSFVYL